MHNEWLNNIYYKCYNISISAKPLNVTYHTYMSEINNFIISYLFWGRVAEWLRATSYNFAKGFLYSFESYLFHPTYSVSRK